MIEENISIVQLVTVRFHHMLVQNTRVSKLYITLEQLIHFVWPLS